MKTRRLPRSCYGTGSGKGPDRKNENAPIKPVIAKRRRRRGNLIRGGSRSPRLLPPGTPALGRAAVRVAMTPCCFMPCGSAAGRCGTRKYIAYLRHSDAATVGGLCRSRRCGPGAACARYRRGRSGASQHGIPDQHLDAAINDRVSRPSRRVTNFCGGARGGRAAGPSLSALET
jgi:hypothetical protein